MKESEQIEPVTVLLLHGYEWKLKDNCIKLSDNIVIGATKGSIFENLYLESLKNGLVPSDDPIEPTEYNVYIQIKEYVDFQFMGGPHVTPSRILNILHICTSRVLSWALILDCDATLKKVHYIKDEYDTLMLPLQRLGGENNEINENSIEQLKKCWETSEKIIQQYGEFNKITNALNYFCYSWRSFYYEHLTVNLCIVLESLFHPSMSNELSHRIASNACRFMGNTVEERKTIYHMIKKCYGYRSKIVHGVPFNEIENVTFKNIVIDTFHFISKSLLKILENPDIAETFLDNAKRQELFDKYIFE
ncbi:MAG: HEPN domain-containing protein [Candidatus Edwardsbacteria bacterium]|nr:HEPN domain-containing protein [Candidatus Edwardsbacteria bacterium]